MPRHAKPLALANLDGSRKKNPQRYRLRALAPQPHEGLGQPPQWLNDAAADVWIEISHSLPAGVLTVADRLAAEVCSQLLAEFRENPKSFQAARLAQLRGLLGSLGLTPSDRLRLSVPETLNALDPWAVLAAQN
jgi:phage terminase small subunit